MTTTAAEQVGQVALSGFAQYENQIAELKRQLEEASRGALACANRILQQEQKISELHRQLEDKEGVNDVQLDFDSNDARAKQQWKLDGKVEMGQLLGYRKNKASGDSEAEGEFVLTDSFSGSDELLINSSTALIELDAENALVPHGIGGHAAGLMSAMCVRFGNLKRQLAESQAREARLREALFDVNRMLFGDQRGFDHELFYAAISIQHDDTALREYRESVIEECALELCNFEAGNLAYLIRRLKSCKH